MSRLKVVALISGGKDSFFSILHTIASGHEVVALANLHPRPGTKDEEDIESYMYQTVGHGVVPLYAEALGLPLYRQAIDGTAIDVSQSYSCESSSENDAREEYADETESLIPLLRRVKAAHPDIDAISSGAILSSYQRTRLESVALRLNFTPLAYLWQYPLLPPPSQTSLLEDMAAVGMDVRIIKVASGGLDASHLWLNVANPGTVAILKRDMGRFGGLGSGAVLGEGGEFETLVVDGPAPLWKMRVEVDQDGWEVVAGEGGTAAVRVRKARLVEKEAAAIEPPDVRMPDLLDLEFRRLLLDLEHRDHELDLPALAEVSGAESLPRPPRISTTTTEDHFFISNLTSSTDTDDISSQLTDILSQLKAHLSAQGLTPDDMLLTTILLRSTSSFNQLNTIYSTLFSRPNPPTRITIALGDTLPPDTHIILSAIASRSPSTERIGLHVQSQSYWAPANIGPYSQAIAHPLSPPPPSPSHAYDTTTNPTRVVYIAGQIPLVPAIMTLHPGPFATQAALALQHLWRVGRAMGVHCWTGAVAFITASDPREAEVRASIAVAAWKGACERRPGDGRDTGMENGASGSEDEAFDVGDAQLRHPWITPSAKHDVDALAPTPDWTRISGSSTERCPACIVAEVGELPRSARVEWVSQGLVLGEYGDRSVARAEYSREGSVRVCKDSGSGVEFCCAVVWDAGGVAEMLGRVEAVLEAAHVHLIEAYTTARVAQEGMEWLESHGAQIIPGRRLWDESGEGVLAVRCRYIRKTNHTE